MRRTILGSLIVLSSTGFAVAQTTATADFMKFQALTYSKQGNLLGCGVRFVVVTNDLKTVDGSVNLNVNEKGELWGLFKVGLSDLKLVKDKMVETKRDVTFAQLKSESARLDTKRGMQSDTAGYYIGGVEGDNALKMLESVIKGGPLFLTVSVKGDSYDHHIKIPQKIDDAARNEAVECLGHLAEKIGTDK